MGLGIWRGKTGVPDIPFEGFARFFVVDPSITSLNVVWVDESSVCIEIAFNS